MTARGSQAGTFKIRVPGSQRVRLTAWHPRLTPAAEGGWLELTRAPEELRLTLVKGGSASFTLDPPIPADAPSNPASYVDVLLFDGTPSGEALQRLTPAHEGGVFTIAGFQPGTYTLVVNVQGRAPAIVDGVTLADTETDLGTIALPEGATVRIRLKVKEGEAPPRIVADARFLEVPAYGRVVNSSGERDVLLRGLGVGAFTLRATPHHALVNGGHGGSQSIERALESDGRSEIVVEMDLR